MPASCQYEDNGKNASGTFVGYLTGTITLVFGVFFIFLLLAVLAMLLMSYARYNARQKGVGSSFQHPPAPAYRPRLHNPDQPPSSGQSTLL